MSLIRITARENDLLLNDYYSWYYCMTSIIGFSVVRYRRNIMISEISYVFYEGIYSSMLNPIFFHFIMYLCKFWFLEFLSRLYFEMLKLFPSFNACSVGIQSYFIQIKNNFFLLKIIQRLFISKNADVHKQVVFE